MPILIHCPQCGRELKLSDPRLLGRKGKCPKCGHAFVLQEDEPIGLAELDSTEHNIAPPPDLETKPPDTEFELNIPAANPGPPAPAALGFPVDFAAIGQEAESTTSTSRTRERLRQQDRKRNFALAIVAAIVIPLIGIIWFLSRPAAPKPVTNPTTPTPQVTESSDELDEEVALSDPSETEYARKGTPTKGRPIDLRYIPFGTQVVINLHPAELWQQNGLGEELRQCVPPLASLIETTLKDLFKRSPEQVDELLICLIPGPRGSLPDVAAVARLRDEQKRSQLIEQFGERIESFDQSVYQQGRWAYLIVDTKTIAICPKSQVDEMVKAIDLPHPVDQISPLLPLTDRDRHLTVIVTPQTLKLHDTWFPENLRAFVTTATEWLGNDIETISGSLHLAPDLFYSDILLRSKTVPAKTLEHNLQQKLSGLAGTLLPLIEQMDPAQQGKRMMIGRLPAMVEVFSMATIFSHAKNHVQLITPLPDRAAPNLFLATYLTWGESTHTDFTKAKPPSTEGSNLPTAIADRLKTKIDVDFRAAPLSEAFSYIGTEIKTSFELDGDALKAGGFTKNLKQNFKLDSTPVEQVILRIFDESKSVDANPEKKLVIVVDEAKKLIVVTTQAAANQKGLSPYPLKAE